MTDGHDAGWADGVAVHEWIRHHARSRPDAPAIGTPADGWTTYAELDDALRSCASVLASSGVGPGDLIVQSSPASTVSVATGFAANLLGAGLVEVSPDLTPDDLSEIVRQTDAHVLVIAGRQARTWAPVAAAFPDRRFCVIHPVAPPREMIAVLGDVTWLGDGRSTAASSVDVTGEPVSADRTALVVYTSGSTGRPNGVVQTHGNIDANSRAIARYLELTDADRAMATLPLFYCYGRSVLQTHLLVGGSIFFDHRFMYPRVVLDEMVAQRCTGFAGVPLTFEQLRQQVDVARLDLSPLRYVTQAGGAMRADTIRWVREAFAPARLFVMYGQTEATARLTYLPPEAAEAKAGSVGIAVDGVELAVLDDSGARLGPGVDGDIVAAGASISPGYLGAPSATADVFRDGWLRTGDVGHLDVDGFLFITGRRKEFLKLAGNRVSPLEIEHLLEQHVGVHEAAVTGWTDARGAEHAIALIVTEDGHALDEDELRRHVRSLAPAYKTPSRVRFVEALPHTGSGKLARSELKELITDDPPILP